MKALVFDAFGTLLDISSLAEPLSRIVDDAPAFLEQWRAKQLEYTFLLALMGRYLPFSEVTRRALETVAARAGRVLDPAREEALVQAWERLPTFPDVEGTLDSLSGRFRLAVLSNADSLPLEKALQEVRLLRHFEKVLSAQEARTYKPHPRVYELACDRLRLPKSDIGLVSSNAFDVLGAKATGLQAIWVNRQGTPFERLGLTPDFEVRAMADLVTRI